MKNWLWLLLCLPVFSQDINLRQIMEDPYWIGEIPSSVSFSLDSKTVYFSVPQPIPAPSKWKALDLASNTVRDVDRNDLPHIFRQDTLKNGSTQALSISGDLWVKKGNQAPLPLMVGGQRVSLIRFSDDGDLIYKQGRNLFSLNMVTGQSLQLTDIKLSKEKKDKETWYSNEEKSMLRYVANLYEGEEKRKASRDKQRQIGPIEKPKATYLGKGFEQAGLFAQEGRYGLDLSPDKRFFTVVLEADKEGKQTEYAQFINKEVAVKALKARPKVGHKTPTWKMAIVDRQSNELTWLNLESLPEIKRDPLAELKKALPEADQKFLPKMGDGPRPVMLLPGGFHPKSKQFLVTAISRDYKDRWIFLVNPESAKIELIQHHYDEAWVTHILRNVGGTAYVSGAAFWAEDGNSVAFVSDHQGYQHLYAYSLKNKKIKALTSGSFEIHNPMESQDRKFWYFHATAEHPGTLKFYRMPIKGGKMTPLTEGNGHQITTLAPDGKTMAALVSTTNQPPILMTKQPGGKWRTGYDGRSDQFKAIAWAQPEVLSYKNRDGKPVYSRLYKPQQSNGAGVIFVHGAGYLQNAHKGWSGYFREYMFHNLLMREGYTVLDPDYQASAGYGRDWRTAIYRHMGGKDLNDIVDGAKFLASQPGVQEQKVGVYGGSYGGFITLMAMFTTPDVFQSGAALRPVTDWAYYNHWYTSRILNTPFDDPEAYRKSSPIYFAEGLKGHLLIAHGMVDSNVQYQDSVRLAQKLIELRKHNWELSSYPVEPHGFRTPSGWYDEYRRIYELFNRTLK